MATKPGGMKRPTKRITGKQRAARKRNIEVARKAKKPSAMKGESTADAFKRMGSNFSPKMLKAIRKAQKEHRIAVAKMKPTKKPVMHTIRRWTDSKGNYRGPL